MNSKIYLIILSLIPCVLLFQNCSLKSSTASSPSYSQGFNINSPIITKGISNQTLLVGLGGGYSGTVVLRNIEVNANAGVGESFQTLTLKCEVTGNTDLALQCNNRNFVDGKATVNIGPRGEKECLSGTANVKYWVEDSDPIDEDVPVLKSAAKNFSIEIKNTCYSESKIYPKERSGQDNFGSNVKLLSNLLFVSAPGEDTGAKNSGAIQVFKKTGANWQHSQTLKMSLSEADIKVSALDAVGTKLVVGSPFSDTEVGAVFAFQSSASTYSEVQVLKPETPNSFGSDHYGHAVATDGQWLAVGAPNDSTENLIARGAIYLYQASGNQWIFNKKLLGESAYEELGTSLSMKGGYLVAGAPENFSGQLGKGSVYVYTNTGTLNTILENAPDIDKNSIFGISVATDGSKIIVGASKAKGKKVDSGAAYIYNLEDGSWKYKYKLQSADGEDDDEFGRSVDVAGNHIAIGSRRESDDKYRKGAAYHFKYINNAWKQSYKLMSRDRVERDYFGTSVSINGSDVAVGAHLDDGEEESFVDGLGATYIYRLK